ncbi:MAG: ribosome maturation factor RimM [Thermoleophilia bacterium]
MLEGLAAMKDAPEWILVGMVKRIHGNTGEMLIKPFSEREERFAAGQRLFLMRKREEERTEVEIETSRRSDRGPLVKLAGVDSRDAAEPLFGASLFIPAAEIGKLKPDSYYPYQIEGCEVYEGERLVGTVTRLAESQKANPYLEIEPADSGKLILIPFVSQAILSVDTGSRRIDIAGGFAE